MPRTPRTVHMSKSARLQTKEERDEFLRLSKIDLESEEANPLGYKLSDYYEKDKPMALKGWKKLIEDLNELFENPPGECEAIEPIEIPENPLVWKLEDVKDLREKMIEMCNRTEFDWGWYLKRWDGSDEDKDLLRFPFGREIFYEIIDQMLWCHCGNDSYLIREIFTTLGVCLEERPRPIEPEPRTKISDLIEGLEVGIVGNTGRWQFYSMGNTDSRRASIEATRSSYAATHPGEAVPWLIGNGTYAIKRASGDIDCNGLVVCNSTCEKEIAVENTVDYRCWPDDSCDWILDLGGDPDDITELYNDCLDNNAERRAESLEEANEVVANASANGASTQYTLVIDQGRPRLECEEETP